MPTTNPPDGTYSGTLQYDPDPKLISLDLKFQSDGTVSGSWFFEDGDEIEVLEVEDEEEDLDEDDLDEDDDEEDDDTEGKLEGTYNASTGALNLQNSNGTGTFQGFVQGEDTTWLVAGMAAGAKYKAPMALTYELPVDGSLTGAWDSVDFESSPK